MQGRANLARKVIAEMTAQYLKAEQEDKPAAKAKAKPPVEDVEDDEDSESPF